MSKMSLQLLETEKISHSVSWSIAAWRARDGCSYVCPRLQDCNVSEEPTKLRISIWDTLPVKKSFNNILIESLHVEMWVFYLN